MSNQHLEFFSETYQEANDEFLAASKRFNDSMMAAKACSGARGKVPESWQPGEIKFYSHPETEYQIPVVSFGSGQSKIVINTGMHGLEGYVGNAFMRYWLESGSGFLSPKFWNNFTIVMIHSINGYGMDHRLRENKNNTDLNRTFRDYSKPVPRNKGYAMAHNLLMSKPGRAKLNALREFYHAHKSDGVWRAISAGQNDFKNGIFYMGGDNPQPETEMVTQIYDDIMRGNATDLLSIGIHTGLGEYKSPTLLGSDKTGHPNTEILQKIFEPAIAVEPDEKDANAANLSGDLVDFLKARFADKKIPIITADLEIGTGTNGWRSPIYKRMDQGDARYEIAHDGEISKKTWKNLSEDWFPKDKNWRRMSIGIADVLAMKLAAYMRATA